MAIKYRLDVMAALKQAGYSSYRLRKERLLGEATIQKIRSGDIIYGDGLDKLCRLLNCQPGDILEHIDG